VQYGIRTEDRLQLPDQAHENLDRGL